MITESKFLQLESLQELMKVQSEEERGMKGLGWVWEGRQGHMPQSLSGLGQWLASSPCLLSCNYSPPGSGLSDTR